MARRIADWFDERTGYRALLSHALDEEIAGGARWAYVFGSGLITLFLVQVLTGLLLMATYTPGVNSAWSSVFYIQYKVAGGWFVRGLHHYGAQAMMVVLGLHLLQVAVYGAYKSPREVTWWFGLGLLGVVQGLGLTGYLLPWDMKGYWATKVATNIAGTVPLVGPAIQTLIVGGAEYGQTTLTRFYVLHVGVLPATLVLLVTAHVALFRRHGSTPPAGADLSRKARFFPAQAARDVAFAVLVVGAIALLTALTRGGHLGAPADPAINYHPRPEWYFLGIYQLLKYLPASLELLGSVVLPGLVGAFLFALPFFDRSASTRVRERWPWLAVIFALGAGMVGLTAQALAEDAADPEYQEAAQEAERRAERAIELAKQGIPMGGALEMLRRDPMTRGRDVYHRECTKCHVLDGEGERAAPDHTGFASRKWILGMIYDPNSKHYFGTTEIQEMEPMGDELSEEELEAVTEFLFAEGHESGDPRYDDALAKRGRGVFEDACTDCHLYEGEGAYLFEGPDMAGYASSAWIENQIKNPGAEDQYGDLNEMPAFDEELSDHDVRMVTQFLRKQRFEEPPFEPAPPAEDAEDAPDAGVPDGGR